MTAPSAPSSPVAVLGAVAIVAIAACGDSGGPRLPADTPSAVTVVDTVDGTQVVRSTGPAPLARVEPLITIGGQGGGAELAPDEFAWVSSVTLGPDHLLYVADIRLDHIAVFDTMGVPRDPIGRQGEGPGEFESVYSLAWVGDTLLAMDIGNARLGRFAAGSWHGYEPAPGRLVASPVTYRLYQVGPDEIYQWAYRPDDDVLEPTWKGHGRAAGVEWPRTSLPLDPPFPDKVVCTVGRGISWFDHPYAARALAHPGPAGTVFMGTSDRYRIVHVSAEGDTLRVIEREAPPADLGDEEWRQIEETHAAWLADKDVGQCQPRALDRPAHKPPVEGIQVDATGRLWVERNMSEGTIWEVFDDAGRLVGAVPGVDHDRQRSVPWLSARHIAWITRDSLDVPYVHLATIRTDPDG